jgi:methylated-DNA-[protein]-cysteine S-methyltransferase
MPARVVATPLGPVRLSWSATGLTRLRLEPGWREGTAPGTPDDAIPPWLEAALAALRTELAGGIADLTMIPLDLASASAFERSVYGLTRAIPRGETRNYGALARSLGDPRLARAVGVALGRNPVPFVVPCHRVVSASGQLGGFSMAGGPAFKRRLLEREGAIPQAATPLLDWGQNPVRALEPPPDPGLVSQIRIAEPGLEVGLLAGDHAVSNQRPERQRKDEDPSAPHD